MSSWAGEIEKLSAAGRGQAKFGPYLVTTEGALRLPIEMLRVNGTNLWPIGVAPGWTNLTLPDGIQHQQWLPLGSEYFFRGEAPKSAHIPQHMSSMNVMMNGADALSLVLAGQAFPFADRFFVLPTARDFDLNSFKYEFPEMENLGVFVGFRGHTKRYPEVLTPQLYRAHKSPSKDNHALWMKKSRIASNVLKQRFLEREGKPLTDLEAIGILQHHYVIGATDMLDLSFDVNVAKWFSLNVFASDDCKPKQFHETHDSVKARAEASCVYSVGVRPIGAIPIAGEAARFLTPGIKLDLWEGIIGTSIDSAATETPPYNLAPLWSTFPQRQRGFGIRGIFPGEFDKFGSVLSVTEHMFHPVFYPHGWDHIGGPVLTINGQHFHWDSDSSSVREFLMPNEPEWFKTASLEAREMAEHLTQPS